MRKIKKGDIVGRKSYGKDILFIVEKIIDRKDDESIAVLKGLIIRIEADAPLKDLVIMETNQIENILLFVIVLKLQKMNLKKSLCCIGQ